MRLQCCKLFIGGIIFGAELVSKLMESGSKHLPVIFSLLIILVIIFGSAVILVPFQTEVDCVCFIINEIMDSTRKNKPDALTFLLGTVTFVSPPCFILGVPLITSSFPEILHSFYVPLFSFHFNIPVVSTGILALEHILHNLVDLSGKALNALTTVGSAMIIGSTSVVCFPFLDVGGHPVTYSRKICKLTDKPFWGTRLPNEIFNFYKIDRSRGPAFFMLVLQRTVFLMMKSHGCELN